MGQAGAGAAQLAASEDQTPLSDQTAPGGEQCTLVWLALQKKFTVSVQQSGIGTALNVS